MGFAVLVNHKVKFLKSETRGKNLNLARELKKICNMKATVIPIVIDAFGTIPKGLVQRMEGLEIRGPVETIQTRAFLRLTRILRQVLET